MQIGSTAGASLSQLLSQMQDRLASQTTSASQASGSSAVASSSTTSSTTSASGTTSVSEDLNYFLSQMSDALMGKLLQSQGADGHQGGQEGPPSLSDIDSNGDGALSQAEMEAFDTSKSGSTDTTRTDQMFSAMDSDGDGSVTATEKSAFDGEMAANRPQRGPQEVGGPPPGPPPSGDVTATSSAASAFSSTESTTDFASLLKDLQSAIEAYSSNNLKSMASASASSLSVAA